MGIFSGLGHGFGQTGIFKSSFLDLLLSLNSEKTIEVVTPIPKRFYPLHQVVNFFNNLSN